MSAYRVVKSEDSFGRTVWHVLDDRDEWVQSYALRREARDAIVRLVACEDEREVTRERGE